MSVCIYSIIIIGLVVESSRLYSQQVPSTFKITMASLGPNTELDGTSNGKFQRTSLIFNLDGKEEFTICSLVNGKIEQQPLDLIFTEGENVSFRVEGPNTIHLTGYHINQDEDDGFINDEDEDEIYSDEAEEDSQIEYDSDDEDEDFSCSEDEETSKPRIRVVESDDEEENSDLSDMADSDGEEEMESDEEEEDEEEEKDQKPAKKVKFEADEMKKAKEATKERAAKPESPTKVDPSPAKPASQTDTKKPTSPQAQVPTPVKKTLPSGLQIEDLKLGNGAKAAKGKTVFIHYKGTLTNGKTFDSSYGSKPLKFVVGSGEVIKGMDIGIIGLAVGGSRKLVIPAALAYGNAKVADIPRNSTLIFEIRLERVL